MSGLFDNICLPFIARLQLRFFVLLSISVVITSGAILSASSSGLYRGQKIELIFRRFSYKQEVGRFEWRRFSLFLLLLSHWVTEKGFHISFCQDVVGFMFTI